MKKIIAFILAFTFIFSLASCVQDGPSGDPSGDPSGNPNGDPSGNPDDDKDDGKDTIDIYLIAGQSNAVGCTAISDRTAAEKFIPKGGFANVHYAGSARTGGNPFNNNEKQWCKTNLGFGANENMIGPEVGLAKALSEYYNEETGRHAGIIKFAHGGSSVFDVSWGENATGNWVSPSYAKYLDVLYNDDDITGGFYRGFLAQVKKNIEQIEAYSGHTKVNIVGLYWMQGETDRDSISEYRKSFKYLVEDLRKDLADIMLEFTNGESDCGAADMPVLIGTISMGFSLSSASTATSVNGPFIAMQRGLASSIENCYVVDNSNFPICKWENNAMVVVGTDRYHWNQADMLQIGMNVGKTFLDEIVNKVNK